MVHTCSMETRFIGLSCFPCKCKNEHARCINIESLHHEPFAVSDDRLVQKFLDRLDVSGITSLSKLELVRKLDKGFVQQFAPFC